MSSPALVIPRLEIDVIDKNGKMDRNWYKFFALMAKSIGPSLTNSDDLQATENTDAASAEAFALIALNIVKQQNFLLFTQDDQPKPQDDIMAWWPGDAK